MRTIKTSEMISMCDIPGLEIVGQEKYGNENREVTTLAYDGTNHTTYTHRLLYAVEYKYKSAVIKLAVTDTDLDRVYINDFVATTKGDGFELMCKVLDALDAKGVGAYLIPYSIPLYKKIEHYIVNNKKFPKKLINKAIWSWKKLVAYYNDRYDFKQQGIFMYY